MPKALTRLTFLTALILAGGALATIVVAETVEELTARSPLVVRATAQQSMTAFGPGEDRIWTWTEFVVTEVVKGRAPGTIVVKQPGGEVGGVGQYVAGVAAFQPGEECLLFLEPAVDEPGAFVVRGLAAGKVTFVDRLGQRLAVRDLRGLAFARPGGKVEPVSEDSGLGTAEAFLTRVRRAAGGAR